jgi:predicted dehydrogenase
MMASKKFKVAIAGSGMVTRHHLNAWAKLPQVLVVAICARHLQNAQARATEFDIPTAYDNVAAMLDAEKPHALDIATPPQVHAEQVKLAAERGINVLCQKPMTPNLTESEQLVAEVGDSIRFMVHENWRFRPQYRQVGQWIAQNKVCRIREFHLTTRSSGLVTRTATGQPVALERQPFLANLKRFIINELLIHHLDTIRFLVGSMKVVASNTSHICQEVIGEDIAQIILNAESGAVGTVSGNFCAAGFPLLPTDRLELIGEKASILFDNNELILIGDTERKISYDLHEAYQTSYDNAIAHFIKSLESGESFETDRLDNLETLRLVSDAYRLAGR